MIAGEAGQHGAKLSFPLSVDHISCAPISLATYHPHVCRDHITDCGNTQRLETNLKSLGHLAVHLHNSICSIHSTEKKPASLSYFLFLVPLYIMCRVIIVETDLSGLNRCIIFWD